MGEAPTHDERAGRTRPQTRPHGVTLLELVIALGLLAIVMGAAAPRLIALLGSLRLPLGAHELAANMSAARSAAVLHNATARVLFSRDGYVLHVDGVEPLEHTIPLPPGIRVVRVPASGGVEFLPSGLASNGTIVLAGPAGDRRAVVVNQRGRVTVR